jgi:hypothetical protein
MHGCQRIQFTASAILVDAWAGTAPLRLRVCDPEGDLITRRMNKSGPGSAAATCTR